MYISKILHDKIIINKTLYLVAVYSFISEYMDFVYCRVKDLLEDYEDLLAFEIYYPLYTLCFFGRIIYFVLLYLNLICIYSFIPIFSIFQRL